MRDLAPEVVEQLKLRARRNRRSLQAEVKEILEDAAAGAALRPSRSRISELLKLADDIRRSSGPQKTDSTEILRKIREA